MAIRTWYRPVFIFCFVILYRDHAVSWSPSWNPTQYVKDSVFQSHYSNGPESLMRDVWRRQLIMLIVDNHVKDETCYDGICHVWSDWIETFAGKDQFCTFFAVSFAFSEKKTACNLVITIICSNYSRVVYKSFLSIFSRNWKYYDEYWVEVLENFSTNCLSERLLYVSSKRLSTSLEGKCNYSTYSERTERLAKEWRTLSLSTLLPSSTLLASPLPRSCTLLCA
jgi:hypothetical protein